MPMHRKNSSKGAARYDMPKGAEADWFIAKRDRDRRRNKMAKLSRRKNRK